MKSEVLLNAFEQMFNKSECVNSVHNSTSYKNGLGMSDGEKDCRCSMFRISAMGEALARIISAFQREEYEFELIRKHPVIKRKGAPIPKDEFCSNKDYILLAIGEAPSMYLFTLLVELFIQRTVEVRPISFSLR